MKPWIVIAVVLTCVIGLMLAANYELHFGGEQVATRKQVNVFDSEYEAANEGALNRPPAKPLSTVPSGENVSVIWDTYGKDYWACYVRTSAGIRGWALCTSLNMKA